MILAPFQSQSRCPYRPALSAAWLIAVCLSWSSANAQDSADVTRIEWDVPENREAGIVIGNLSEHFPKCSSFELIEARSTDGFSINPETGAVTLTRPGVLNHERSTVATLDVHTKETLVEAQDPYAAQFSASLLEEGISADRLKELTHRSQTVRLTINVLDAPEAPVVRETKFTVTENAASGTIVGTVEAVDSDRRESLRFNIDSGNVGQIFTIDSATGVLRVSDGQQPDFEKSFLFDLIISVSDKDDMVGFGHCSVQVINVDESRKPAPKPTTREPAFVETPGVSEGSPALNSGSATTGATADTTSTKTIQSIDKAPRTESPSSVAGPVPTMPVDPSNDKALRGSGRKIIPPPPTETTDPSVAIAIAKEPAAKSPEPDVPAPALSPDVPLPTEGAAGWKPELALSASGHESQSLGLNGADGQSNQAETPAGYTGSSLRSTTSSPKEVTGPQSGAQKAAWILLICVVPGLAAAGVVYWRQRKAAAASTEVVEAAKPEGEIETAEAKQDELADAITMARESSLDLIVPEGNATPAGVKPQTLTPAIELDDEGPFDPESLLSDEYFEPARDDQMSPAISYSSGHTPAGSGYDHIEESLRRNLSEIRRDLADYQQEFRPQDRDVSPVPPFVTAESTRFDGPAIPLPVGILASQSGSSFPTESDTEQHSPHASSDVAVITAQTVEIAPPLPLPESEDLGTTHILDARTPGEPPSSGASALRSELAELFDLHSRSGIAQSAPLPPKTVDENSDTDSSSENGSDGTKPERIPVPAGTPSQLADEEHRNSVARYLDSLLQKKKPEEIVTDRRKSASPHSGPERRATENAKKPAKSFIESYLEQHGGKLPDSPEAPVSLKGAESSGDRSRFQMNTTEEPATPGPQIPRTPVDVSSIREHMTSFREVATRSVEQALASYQMKQVKGRLALRTMLIIALVFVTGLIYAGNAAGFMQFAALNHLMGLAILLALGELSLQMVTYWKTHRDMTSVARGDAERRAEEQAEAKSETVASEKD